MMSDLSAGGDANMALVQVRCMTKGRTAGRTHRADVWELLGLGEENSNYQTISLCCALQPLQRNSILPVGPRLNYVRMAWRVASD